MYKKFNQNNPKDKDIIITIKRLGINGEGIGYYRKKIIFIPGALPNEVVVAKIITEYPRYIDAELVRIKEKVLTEYLSPLMSIQKLVDSNLLI